MQDHRTKLLNNKSRKLLKIYFYIFFQIIKYNLKFP